MHKQFHTNETAQQTDPFTFRTAAASTHYFLINQSNNKTEFWKQQKINVPLLSTVGK
jgi:hypothetical protein